ncbi:protein kinase domain-containing protein [Thermomonas carbonis]|uniref:Protein kinase n=1 Tax=Thermomonas carbonis TaxID=1463158 RepID=A0A7G9SPM9_9GAMM|nr:protein kinase [Thermomonas carbonis]QNN69804.1 protein kinase [Thermomonas carbonis]GHB95617.1 hypothetical protein GCM10010080_03990 [Thermomonas carbonis]
MNPQDLNVPGYELLEVLGRGANATVYLAQDERLNRKVAVKVWNRRGEKRAQQEASKIASFSHHLIVATFLFGRVGKRPFCVMEYVAGKDGKSWLRAGPPLSERLEIWRQYTTALRHIHHVGAVHGDPHLGNILIRLDVSRQDSRESLSLKLADAGTSRYWNDHTEFDQREADLILETASRIFVAESFDALWIHPQAFGYGHSLDVLDECAKYLSIAFQNADQDMQALVATNLADLIYRYPFFDIETVIAQVQQSGVTTGQRLVRRLNAKLHRITNVLDAATEWTPESREIYSDLSVRRAYEIKMISG